MAGVVPGLLLGAAIIALCIYIGYRDGHPRGDRVPLGIATRVTVDALWGLITIVIIIGGILTGVFTAIEAGAIATLWAFFVTMFIYRDYPWRDLPTLVHRTLKTWRW
jgi:TRAP-type C4-dicarboxylate transport system permease large subunit